MSLDHRLIELLVCPVCKGPLQLRRDAEQRPLDLACPADRLAFPIRDGIPVMLESEAGPLEGALNGVPDRHPSPIRCGLTRGMNFTVLIPARLSSTRLPDKPLADIAGKPMVVRVAERAALSGAATVVVACDDTRIAQACAAHGVRCVLTRTDHLSGSDRLAEACALLGLQGDDMVVNVQGDEPLIEPELVRRVALLLAESADCVMSTAAHPLEQVAEYLNPNVVKVVLDAAGRALYFSRAPIPWWRDGPAPGAQALPSPAPLRHLGLYAYRASFLRAFPSLPPATLEQTEALEQLRVLWHGHRIAVHVAAQGPGPGVDTPEDLARVRALFAARAASV